jgi:hypothetical protein
MMEANDGVQWQTTLKHVKKTFLILACVSVISLAFIYKKDSISLFYKKKPVRLFVNNQTIGNKTYKVLFLTSFFSGANWLGTGQKPFEKCSFKNCFASSDLHDYNSSDAALISLLHMRPLPTWRPPAQKWFIFIMESPVRHFLQGKKYNNIFNATITYRKTSEIYHPYGETFRRETVLAERSIDFKSKVKMAAWFVSNCKTGSKREFFVKELQKYIPVDVFGKCGEFKCPRFQHPPDPCLQLLNTTYKFYLSFENSICKDYITEKVWNILKLDIIPVVLGGANYTLFMPPHSYIDIKDFSSVKELGEYLMNMDEVEYNKYFEWKRIYVISTRLSFYCKICQYLNENENKTKIYERLDLFWGPKSECIELKNYYKGFNDFKVS